MAGTISGLPAAPAGTASFTVQVTDNLGAVNTAALSIATVPAPFALADGGTASTVLAVPGGALGLITGMPVPPTGTATFTVQVADITGARSVHVLSIATTTGSGPNYGTVETAGTGTGTWVNPAYVTGAPDSLVATWTAP